MWPFKSASTGLRQTPVRAPVLPAKEKPSIYHRLSNREWGFLEGETPDASSISVQVLQDLRDELKAINAKLAQMDENFKIVFGVEEKAKDGDS